MEMLQHIVAYALIGIGSFLVVVGAIGLNRMPDVYTRMHATSVSDTLGAMLILVGLMFEAGLTLVSAKLAIIILLFFFTGPVATHAVARAALSFGVEPVLRTRDGKKGKGIIEPDGSVTPFDPDNKK
ncbi:MAG: monovalent cation/H(+) antiporter subunit G [Flavobacteriaceae bacterium]